MRGKPGWAGFKKYDGPCMPLQKKKKNLAKSSKKA